MRGVFGGLTLTLLAASHPVGAVPTPDGPGRRPIRHPASSAVRAHGPRLAAFQQRTRFGSMRADPAERTNGNPGGHVGVVGPKRATATVGSVDHSTFSTRVEANRPLVTSLSKRSAKAVPTPGEVRARRNRLYQLWRRGWSAVDGLCSPLQPCAFPPRRRTARKPRRGAASNHLHTVGSQTLDRPVGRRGREPARPDVVDDRTPVSRGAGGSFGISGGDSRFLTVERAPGRSLTPARPPRETSP